MMLNRTNKLSQYEAGKNDKNNNTNNNNTNNKESLTLTEQMKSYQPNSYILHKRPINYNKRSSQTIENTNNNNNNNTTSTKD